MTIPKCFISDRTDRTRNGIFLGRVAVDMGQTIAGIEREIADGKNTLRDCVGSISKSARVANKGFALLVKQYTINGFQKKMIFGNVDAG